MSDYVIMPKTDYEAACNAIREKTGKTDLIKSGDLGTEIGGITCSGSSADVRYVTFMNGNTVLYKKPVAVGDDCVDVLSKDLIETPTKESTVQYDYTYCGWGTSDNGAADTNILKNITEDKTVYAIYTATLRMYTITYLDDDGVTVLKTETLVYGSMPSYTPIKTGYAFKTWTPDLITVMCDVTYTATWTVKHPEEEEGYALVLPTTDVPVTYTNGIYRSEAVEAYENLVVGSNYRVSFDGNIIPILFESKTYTLGYKVSPSSSEYSKHIIYTGIGNPWAVSYDPGSGHQLCSVTADNMTVEDNNQTFFIYSWKNATTGVNYIRLFSKYSGGSAMKYSVKIQRVL